MTFTKTELEIALENYGELMVVLESDREYALHPHDTEFDGDVVKTEGVPEGGNDYMEVVFPVDVVEHYYTHREL